MRQPASANGTLAIGNRSQFLPTRNGFDRGVRLMAIRKGPWKAHFITQGSYAGDTKPKTHDPPLLYHLGIDPSEKWDVAKDNPDVVAELIQAAEEHKKTVEPVQSQLEIPLAAGR